MRGAGGNDVLTGRKGEDNLYGGGGDDLLKGGGGSDVLDGGTGDDELRGWKGNDTYTGGAGYDRFVFSAWETGSNVITDFSQGEDVIVLSQDLSAGAWPTIPDILASEIRQGANTVYELRPGLTVRTTVSLAYSDIVIE